MDLEDYLLGCTLAWCLAMWKNQYDLNIVSLPKTFIFYGISFLLSWIAVVIFLVYILLEYDDKKD